MTRVKCISSWAFVILWLAPVLGMASDQIDRLSPDLEVIGPDGVQRTLGTYLSCSTVVYLFKAPSFRIDHSFGQALQRKGIRCLGICLDPVSLTPDQWMPFMLLRTADPRLYEAYQAEHLPLRVLIDRDGTIRYRGDDPSALLAEVEKSLKTDIDESTWAKIKELFR